MIDVRQPLPEPAHGQVKFASVDDPGDQVADTLTANSSCGKFCLGERAKEDAVRADSHSQPRWIAGQRFNIRIRRERVSCESGLQSERDCSKLRLAAELVKVFDCPARNYDMGR